MAIDVAEKKGKTVQLSKKPKKEALSSQAEETDQEDEESEGSEISSDEEYDSECPGRTSSEEDWVDDKSYAKGSASKPVAAAKRSIKDPKLPVGKEVREEGRKRKREITSQDLPEKKKEGPMGRGKKRPELPAFTDKDVDIDLFHSSPTNVVPVKIKVSSNLIVSCRNVDQAESKNITYDYAAVTIQRKTGTDKMFEFIMPLSLTPRIISAMKLIMRENTKFFEPERLEDLNLKK